MVPYQLKPWKLGDIPDIALFGLRYVGLMYIRTSNKLVPEIAVDGSVDG